MLDVDTFLTVLYVAVDEFCTTRLPPEVRPGPAAALGRSEVVALATFGQWGTFPTERAFYRYALRRLRGAFPGLPARSQFNRLARRHRDATTAFALFLSEQPAAGRGAYEPLDTVGVPTRNAKRRGSGWLPGQADVGYSPRLGWYEGFHLLLAVTPAGAITGFGFGPASAKDQPLAEALYAARQRPSPRLPSAGRPADGPAVADTGFEGTGDPARWPHAARAPVLVPPKGNSRRPWPAPLRRWWAGLRQIVETVNGALLYTFRLLRERPHDLTGFQARLAAHVALHNFCLCLNAQLGRPRLAFADLIDW
jgi:hypothetical protein